MNLDRNYKLYMHTNMSNNKRYIGITQTTTKRRWRNGRGYEHQRYFYFAIQKYGWDSFEHEVLFCNLTKEQAELLEIEIIKYYKSNSEHYGYNIANGGRTKGSVSDSTRKKLSIAAKGRVSTKKGIIGVYLHEEDTKLRISKTMKEKNINIGSKNPMYGKEAPNRRAIICVETSVIYCSLKEAQDKTGIQFKNIHKVCQGKRHTAGGYHWKYVE